METSVAGGAAAQALTQITPARSARICKANSGFVPGSRASGTRASLNLCEAVGEVGLDLFGATLTLGSILVDLGELELHAVDHAVPVLIDGVVVCTAELVDRILVALDLLDLCVDRRCRRFEGVALLEVSAVARS